ncbi:MAG: creatininase family protein [Bacteroidota bacterium]|nr:creatininase family protein [Bacteroidota bacterium]
MKKITQQGVDLTVTPYGKVKDLHYDLGILPWGATEPHNLHLPYLTDCILSQAIAIDAAILAKEKSNVLSLVLPPIPMGSQNPGQSNLPFCIHSRYETQKAILTDIVASLYCQGLRKMVIVNGHGGNSFKNMIRDLAVDYPDFVIAVANWYEVIPQEGFFEVIDDHAGEQETSVMMHYYPELVSLENAGDGKAIPFGIQTLNDKVAWIPRNWSKVTADTGIGNPKKSTAEKGKVYAEAVVEKLSELFIELVKGDIYQ